MTKVAIVIEPTETGAIVYRAIAGERQSVGKTAGEALDALTAQLPEEERGLLVIVQHFRHDSFFTAEQQERLKELMARDAGTSLSYKGQTELDALMEAEIRAAIEHAVALLKQLEP